MLRCNFFSSFHFEINLTIEKKRDTAISFHNFTFCADVVCGETHSLLCNNFESSV